MSLFGSLNPHPNDLSAEIPSEDCAPIKSNADALWRWEAQDRQNKEETGGLCFPSGQRGRRRTYAYLCMPCRAAAQQTEPPLCRLARFPGTNSALISTSTLTMSGCKSPHTAPSLPCLPLYTTITHPRHHRSRAAMPCCEPLPRAARRPSAKACVGPGPVVLPRRLARLATTEPSAGVLTPYNLPSPSPISFGRGPDPRVA